MTFWTGGTGTTYIIDISITWLTLVIVRYFLATSSVLKVSPKGVRWQAWGAGGRRWRRVLTYRTASCNICSNFNCDNAIYAWCQPFKHSLSGPGNQHRQGWSLRPYWWETVNLATLIITDNGRPLWHLRVLFWRSFASDRLCISSTPCQVVPCL